MPDITKIDKNFIIDTSVERDNIRFYSVKDEPFSVHGLIHEGGKYRRMPEVVANTVSPQVASLHACCAGGRVRFRTDSPYIAISAKMEHILRMPHFALTGVSGFDMYDGENFAKCFVPPLGLVDGYSAIYDFPTQKMREITINFPLYADVCELYIGLDKDARLEGASGYRGKSPVVYYGSSITQGGCASRPGNAYEAIISRRLNIDHINLGFSGSAKGEDEIMDYIASLDMSVFVYDYDYNAPTLEHLLNTHERGFKKIREAHPDLPIIMLSRPTPTLEPKGYLERYEIIKQTYENARASGDKNVYLICGTELFKACGGDGTVDGVHPTDFGFHSMADAIIPVLEEILNDNEA